MGSSPLWTNIIDINFVAARQFQVIYVVLNTFE